MVDACCVEAASGSAAVLLVVVLLRRQCVGGGLLLFAKGRFLTVLGLVRTITKFLLHILFLETKSNEALIYRFLYYSIQRKYKFTMKGPLTYFVHSVQSTIFCRSGQD